MRDALFRTANATVSITGTSFKPIVSAPSVPFRGVEDQILSSSLGNQFQPFRVSFNGNAATQLRATAVATAGVLLPAEVHGWVVNHTDSASGHCIREPAEMNDNKTYDALEPSADHSTRRFTPDMEVGFPDATRRDPIPVIDYLEQELQCASVSFYGTVEQVNKELESLRFKGDSNYHGNFSIHVTVIIPLHNFHHHNQCNGSLLLQILCFAYVWPSAIIRGCAGLSI